MKRYAISSQYNMRDLGGYVTSDGQVTALGQIIRSDRPMEELAGYLTEEGFPSIGCVIDLRRPEETESRPSYFFNQKGIEYHNVTFENGNVTPESEGVIAGIYLKMLEEGNSINRILKTIAESDGPVLYHCAIGKDRTGMISAIILSICGVPKEDIIVDYQVSETYIHRLISQHREGDQDLPSWYGRSKPKYMRECLSMLEEKYGSFEEYMKALQVPEETIKGIRRKLGLQG